MLGTQPLSTVVGTKERFVWVTTLIADDIKAYSPT